MSFLQLIFFISLGLFTNKLCSQNVRVNVLTQNSGIVKVGANTFLEISITNTSSNNYIGTHKLKVQIDVPSILHIDSIGHQFPTGWKIIEYTKSTVTLSNGMDMIAATDNRSILISLKGITVGGPSTIIGRLSFSDGLAPGTSSGTMKDDLPGDNSSTTTAQVIQQK